VIKHALCTEKPKFAAVGIREVIMKNQLKTRIALFLKGWGLSLLIALVIATSVKSSLADWNDIPSGSMQPTILVGDRVVVNKLAYDLKIPYTTRHLATWADPQRGDIVVFYSPKDGTRLIKRVVGIPGDILSMRDNRLLINGEGVPYAPLQQGTVEHLGLAHQERYQFFAENLAGTPHSVMFSPTRPSLTSFGPVTVPAGQYFMMGDNRDNSFDSRFLGFVKREEIVGRATMVALSRDGSFLHPRWWRFFKELI
jgi:signal peptidase I